MLRATARPHEPTSRSREAMCRCAPRGSRHPLPSRSHSRCRSCSAGRWGSRIWSRSRRRGRTTRGSSRRAISVLPFIVSFGLLPSLVTLSADPPSVAAGWAWIAGAALGVAVHLTNVLPDLEDDAATGVRGLPHRLGGRVSAVLAAIALVIGAVAVLLGPVPEAGLTVVGVVIFVGVVGIAVAGPRARTRAATRALGVPARDARFAAAVRAARGDGSGARRLTARFDRETGQVRRDRPHRTQSRGAYAVSRSGKVRVTARRRAPSSTPTRSRARTAAPASRVRASGGRGRPLRGGVDRARC